MITVDQVTDHRAFLGLEAEWNDAVERAAVSHPFLRHEWLRTWWDCFGAGARLHLWIARSGGRIEAIAPLMSETSSMYGVPIRRLRLMHNDHTPRADFIVCDKSGAALGALWNAIVGEREGWDVVQLGQLSRESTTGEILTGLAAKTGCSTGVWNSGASPFLTLTGTWDDYTATLSPKFRQNLRNRLTRLKKIGEPALETIPSTVPADRLRGGADLETACRDVVRIEAAAWKHSEGTAIASDPAVDRLYRRFADRAADQGWLRLYFLTVNGHRIATSYSLCYQRRLFLFKTGYDPAYAACSPFKLLTSLILRDAFASGLQEVDFLGDPEPWKLDWTTTTRPHDWLYIFSNTVRGRLLHPVKFQVIPALRRSRAMAPLAS